MLAFLFPETFKETEETEEEDADLGGVIKTLDASVRLFDTPWVDSITFFTEISSRPDMEIGKSDTEKNKIHPLTFDNFETIRMKLLEMGL